MFAKQKHNSCHSNVGRIFHTQELQSLSRLIGCNKFLTGRKPESMDLILMRLIIQNMIPSKLESYDLIIFNPNLPRGVVIIIPLCIVYTHVSCVGFWEVKRCNDFILGPGIFSYAMLLAGSVAVSKFAGFPKHPL